MGNSCCHSDCFYIPTVEKIDGQVNEYTTQSILPTNATHRPLHSSKSIISETTRYDGGICEGDIHSSHGVIRYLNGDVYVGEWKNGRANGYGKIVRMDGTIFEGYMKNDIAEGQGKEILKLKNLEAIYEGNFLQGAKNGKGTLYFSNNAFYEGEFIENKFEGFGKYQFADQKIYIGQWKKNKYHGWGMLLWPDGRLYEGGFKDDMKDGIGTFAWRDSRKYVGEWVEGKQHGKGIFFSSLELCRAALWNMGERIKWLTEPLHKRQSLDLLVELNLSVGRPLDLPIVYFQELMRGLNYGSLTQLECDVSFPYSVYFQKKISDRLIDRKKPSLLEKIDPREQKIRKLVS